MGANTTISDTANTNQPGVNNLPLSAAEQALKDRIDRYNQLPEVKGEELVDQYLKVQSTASVIKSAVDLLQQSAQSDDQANVIGNDVKELMLPEIEEASSHLHTQASEFLASCKKFTTKSSG